MKCLFCHNEIKNRCLSLLYDQYNESDYCDCGGCTTYYNISVNGDIVSYGIHIEYKDKKYAALFHPGKEFTLEHWSDDGPLLDGKVFTLKFHPNITPQNFLKKLPILLVFS